jgi:1-aminocyclopropane-1-carboxylate deaminase/D-cysteine desulfhydrase-like pyridoxal-dependent ACC family enzyme
MLQCHVLKITLQVRKLEFLLADAVASQHDCVITIGDIQLCCNSK